MDKQLLFKPRLAEADVDVPGLGQVRVRGLSRGEVIAMRKATDDANLDGPRALIIERKMLALGMVQPQLSEVEVARWQDASPAGELEPVTAKISELSGMAEGADKRAYQSFRGDTGSRDGVLPSSEVVDDGGPAPAGDEQ